jgi:siroheme synthase-like protein
MPRAPVYPLFLNLTGQPVLIVGGGNVGLRKAKGLVEAGARVTVVSPAFAGEFKALKVAILRAAYAGRHMKLQPWRLVFAATDVRAVNARVRRDAAAAGVLCSRADDPDESDFAGGAHMRVGVSENGGAATFAVSTAGASPILASRLCHAAVASADPVLIQLAALLTEWRAEVKRTVKDPVVRRAFLQQLAGDEMEALLRERGIAAAKKAFRQGIARARSVRAEAGKARGGR